MSNIKINKKDTITEMYDLGNLVHSPTRYGGPVISNLYTKACTARISMFIGHLRKADATTDIIKISLGCCQQELGIGDNFLTQSYSKYGWTLQNCWIKEMWVFLDKIEGNIRVLNDWIQECRKGDTFLMKIVHEIDTPNDKIKIFNLCRLYKRVTFLSETLDHTQSTWAPELFHPTIQMPTGERFPIIEIPKRYWPIWNNILKTICSSQQILINTIGKYICIADSPWIITRDRIHFYQKLEKFYVGYKLDSINKNVYYYNNSPLFRTHFGGVDHLLPVTVSSNHSAWVVKQPKDKVSKTLNPKQLLQERYKFKPPTIALSRGRPQSRLRKSKPPVSTIRLHQPSPVGRLGEYDVHKYEEYREWRSNNRLMNMYQETKVQIKRYNFNRIPEGDSQDGNELFERLSKIQPLLRRVVGQIVSLKNLDHLAMSIIAGEAIGVCDASLNDDNYGSLAYIIESRDEHSFIKGVGPMDCDEDDADSTRAEMTGILAIL